MILSYVNVFRLLGYIFILLAPMVLIMKKPSKPSGTMTVH